VCFRKEIVCVCVCANLKSRLLVSLCHHPHCPFMIDRVHLFPCSKLNCFAINSLLKIAKLLNAEPLIVIKSVYGQRSRGRIGVLSTVLPRYFECKW
jgi:hypothetical protein